LRVKRIGGGYFETTNDGRIVASAELHLHDTEIEPLSRYKANIGDRFLAKTINDDSYVVEAGVDLF
jgi:hypothetical protein